MRKSKLLVLRVTLVVSLCIVVVVYCRRSTTYSHNTLLCSQQEVNFSRAQSSEPFSVNTPESNLKYSQLLQDILRSYQHYHAARRIQFAVGTTSRALTWYCVSECGGIGDRVMGMCTAFLLALVTNRTFFIYQSDEVQRTMFIERHSIDWRPVHKCVELVHGQTIEYFGEPSLFQTVFQMTTNFSLELDRLYTTDNIYISHKGNVLGTVHSILESVISANLSPSHLRLLQYLVESGESASLHAFVTVLHQFLFRLPMEVRHMTISKLSQLKLQPHGFVTVQIRTGFMNSLVGEMSLFNSQFWQGIRFARTQESWRNMMKCAVDVSDSRFGEGSRILVVSDDREPKIWAASEYGSRVTMLDIDPVHVANKPTLGVFRSKSREVYLDTWVELSVMAESWAIVSIYSGYAEVASHMGSMDSHSVYIYDISQKTCTHLA
ncbi:hypothetical protein GBAR_LOCUS14735 [Geodia barretti]|uniref:Uncharacterized protein n=1 Tax=Geodia barretti TaxID=519541 RepID=A0AA35S989_GEOBA|nr:hypothetical protein GBAR_LOCUS14735 [Geodia barretti]